MRAKKVSFDPSKYVGATKFQTRFRPFCRFTAQRLWRFTLIDFDKIPTTGPAILCANHISFLDSVFLLTFSPRNMSVVGKSEYMDSFKTRWLFTKIGMIPLDRTGGENATVAMSVVEKVLERGELFGIFPEGTRSRSGKLYKGRTGAARLALKFGCPVLPVGITGTDAIMAPDTVMPKFGRRCRIEIGDPIDTRKYLERADDPEVLRQLTDEIMTKIQALTGQEYVHDYAPKRSSANRSHI
ncbi:MAG: 1-acyl-sn-glycerol-3-phosphate acyltransferase [Actinobacteria bacterium]|nr:1-acyl-sn-glycerol-3-phosphate acyltransferase [Actinomycetota bacterium]